MISQIQTYIGNTGVKDAKVQNTAEKVNELDRIHLLNRKGSQVTIEAGIVYRCLLALANSRNISPEQYLLEFKKLLEEKQDEDVKKSE